MKGDKCDFLHQYDLSRMPECMFFLKFGKCSEHDCIFRHVAPSERPECVRYRLGFCRYGPLCRSRHDRLPRDALPDLLPDWFLESLIVNSHLIPRSSETLTADSRRLKQDLQGASQELALVPVAPATEQGTIPGLLPPIHGKCRYFFIRSMNVRNIQISAAKGVWATSPGNSQRLRQAFKDVNHVIVIFSATESRNFQGYAKMMCEPDDMLYPGIWGDMSCRLAANFRVHWIKQCTEPLGHADHIKNPQNEDQPVRRCRDGQELPSSVGERLCRFLWQVPDVDLLKGTDLEFEPRESYAYPPPVPPVPPEAPAAESSQAAAAARAEGGSGAPPFAVEDLRQSGNEQEGDRSRPAPVPLGTFQREAKDERAHGRMGAGRRPYPHAPSGCEARPYGQAPITVGGALASGSSSLLAAMAEEAHWPGHPARMWPPPPVGWRPPPPDWMRGGFPPPAEYYPPMPPAYPHHPFPGGSASMAPYGDPHHGNYWGERTNYGPPPLHWEGASGATNSHQNHQSHREARRSSNEDLGQGHRHRSRSHHKRAKHKHRK